MIRWVQLWFFIFEFLTVRYCFPQGTGRRALVHDAGIVGMCIFFGGNTFMCIYVLVFIHAFNEPHGCAKCYAVGSGLPVARGSEELGFL